MNYNNYHTHTNFCDGKNKPEDYIQNALENQFQSLGFSAHAPIKYGDAWCMKEADLEAYARTIKELKEKYKNQLTVYLSLEIDYLPEYSKPFAYYQNKLELDYTIGAIHLVKVPNNKGIWFIDGPAENYRKGVETLFYGDVKKAVTLYYEQMIEMIETQHPNILAHFDKVKMNNKGILFKEDENWYKNLWKETLNIAKKHNTIIEINTRGIYRGKTDKLFPDCEQILYCKQNNIPITISQDAHKPQDLTDRYGYALDTIKKCGVEELMRLDKKEWTSYKI